VREVPVFTREQMDPGKLGNIAFLPKGRPEMKKPKQVLFVRQNPDSIKKLQERLATIDAMQRQLTMKTARSIPQKRRSPPAVLKP
jgi:hypothetical protein